MRRDIKYLTMARDCASFSSDIAKYRMGAVIVQNGRDIVSTSHNYYIKNGNDLTIHAEVGAVLRANKARLKDSTVYIAGYRIKRNDGAIKHICSRPCKRCRSFLKRFDVKWCVFFDDNEEVVRELV